MSDCCCKDTKKSTLVNCPLCGNKGMSVNKITVESLNKSDIDLPVDDYYLCLDEDCDVAYFSENLIIKKDELKVPISYKKDSKIKYICYCSELTVEELVTDIKQKNLKIVKDVVEHTNAMKISDCISKNPSGKCCSNDIKKLLNEVIN